MLVNLNDILYPAKANKYAIAHFKAVDLEMARAEIEAAEETGMPIIIGTAENLLSVTPLQSITPALLSLAKDACVPVAVHYDLGRSIESCLRAIRAGYTSVMLDLSSEPYGKNASETARLVKIAHEFDTAVEGAIGEIPEASDMKGFPVERFTSVKEAKRFAEETNIDTLSVFVGNAYGRYRSAPILDIGRIAELSSAVRVPLSLHGGSGLSDSNYLHAIGNGISKISIFTDIDMAEAQGIIQAVNDGRNLMTEIIPYEIHAAKNMIIEKIQLFENR